MKRILYVLPLFLLLGISVTQAQITTKKAGESLMDKTTLIRLLQTSLDELLQLTEPLTQVQFDQIPADSSWSVNEIIEHLSQIEDGFLREYFVAINIPPVSEEATIRYTKDSVMLAYETTPEKTRARGTNLPLNRYCTKEDALRILKTNRAETIRVITDEKRDLRKVYSYRAKASQVYEAKDMYQHFLLLMAHMKRHTHQLQQVVDSL